MKRKLYLVNTCIGTSTFNYRRVLSHIRDGIEINETQ